MNEKTPKQECEELMNSLVPVAKLLLKEQGGEFLPFGGYMEPDGQIIHVGVEDPETDYPGSAKLMATLQTTFREQARNQECKAVAIVCDVRLKPPKTAAEDEAIQVSLEHVDGYSVTVYFPYAIVAGEVRFGETFATTGDQAIFRGAQ